MTRKNPVARRTTTRGSWLPKTVPGRRRLTALVVLLAAGAAGYLATCIAYPTPMFRRDHAVPRVIGLPITEAEQVLTRQGFRAHVVGDEADPEIPGGAVLWQDPPPDLIAPQGTTVDLTRSTGPAPVPVPDVSDFEVEEARRVLTAAGLQPGTIDSVPSGTPQGIVTGTRPPAGSARPPGSAIDLLVSQGTSGASVPNVVGLRQDEAERQLRAAGFQVGRVLRAEGRRGPPGTVVEQRPNAGTPAPRRARVDLTVTEVI